jgi:hypothetical protein
MLSCLRNFLVSGSSLLSATQAVDIERMVLGMVVSMVGPRPVRQASAHHEERLSHQPDVPLYHEKDWW